MNKFLTVTFSSSIFFFSLTIDAASRDTIKIVGSSTVYPFATVVAERFGKKQFIIHL